MYKLLLVDDEEEVRKGILKKIDWQAHGFEVCGEAENGREALEIAEKIVPDVVVTDIKMPFMDGMELCTALRQKYPTIKIIILTGFDEFEYAQKAIKLNVAEYALKPISADELTDLLIKVKSQVDNESLEKRDLEILREHYRKSLPVLKENFLYSLVSRRLPYDQILEKAAGYGFAFSGKCFVAAAISIDYQSIHSEKDNIIPMSKARYFNTVEDRELMQFAVLNITQEIMGRYEEETVFVYNDYIVLISGTPKDNGDQLLDRTLAVLEEIRQAVEKYLKFTVTIGVGMVSEDASTISSSFSSAVNALDYRITLGNNRILWIEDIEPVGKRKVAFDELREKALISCIKVGTVQELESLLEEFFQEIQQARASFKEYQLFLLELLTAVLKVAQDLGVDMDRVLGESGNLFVELYGLKELPEVKQWFSGICSKIMGSISKDRQDSCKLLVEQAKQYIQQYYHESDMTIDRICRHLHISPAYFSTLFKKETKLTFVTYLTQVRMEAAKELLRSTNLKFFEIAEKVGYSEPNYFSYSFKRNTGMSPSEYRNS